MSEHAPSNMATYQTNNGRPVFDTFFVLSSVCGELNLFAFASDEQRKAVIEAQQKLGKSPVSISHKAAFDYARDGMPIWLYEGGNCDVMTFTPLSLAAGNKGGWKPRVIEGGLAVAPLE